PPGDLRPRRGPSPGGRSRHGPRRAHRPAVDAHERGAVAAPVHRPRARGARPGTAVRRGDRMNILWVKTELLHPLDKGGKLRTYHMLRELKRHHRITYVTLDDGAGERDALARATEYCDEVITVPFHPPAKGSARFYLDLARNLVSKLPYAVARYRSGALRDAISKRLATGDVHIVVCDFLAPSVNVPDDVPCPAVLFEHNVE